MTSAKTLQHVADSDVSALLRAAESYGDSWRKRGGVGAFMMLARKWDRIENRVANPSAEGPEWDIFKHIIADQRAEGIIDDIRDLRRYLLLVESHLQELGVPAAQTKSRDEL